MSGGTAKVREELQRQFPDGEMVEGDQGDFHVFAIDWDGNRYLIEVSQEFDQDYGAPYAPDLSGLKSAVFTSRNRRILVTRQGFLAR